MSAWTTDSVEQLIEELHGAPCLWDKRDVDYRNLDVRNNVLQGISDRVGRAVPDVTAKLRNLRDTFSRNYREYGTTGTGRPGGPRKAKWTHFDRLFFLSEHLRSERYCTAYQCIYL